MHAVLHNNAIPIMPSCCKHLSPAGVKLDCAAGRLVLLHASPRPCLLRCLFLLEETCMMHVAVQYDVAVCGGLYTLTKQSLRCHGFCQYKLLG